MDESITNWLDQIAQNKLNPEDVERSLRYAKDLEQGLAKIRTYSQGVSIFGSARLPMNGKWCKLAEQLGYKLAQNGHPVITGGGPSIMEAANKGAYEAGGRSIGLNIQLAHEQHINPYVTDEMEFHYFFARKVMLTMSSKVYVFFPGGFGTLDEFSEILILMQEGKMPKMPMFPRCNHLKPSMHPIVRFIVLPIISMKSSKPQTKLAIQVSTTIFTTISQANSNLSNKNSPTRGVFYCQKI